MEKIIKNILLQCKKNSKMNTKSTSYPAFAVIDGLEKLRFFFEQELKVDSRSYEYKISRGSGFFPKNPWIAIVKKGTKVLGGCACNAYF